MAKPSTPAPADAGAASSRETRDRGHPIKVYVTATERAEIEGRAEAAGLSASAYLRAIGLNEPVRSMADSKAVLDLLKINADLGRLGGLLKLWLSEKAGQGARPVDVRQTLRAIQDTQRELMVAAGRVRRRR